MEKMENMENPKKLAVATIAGLTEVAGMAAPAMADETAADPMVGQTQSADPTKDALDKANTAVSESQTAYDNAQQNVQDAQSKVDDAYASDPATNAAQSELDAAQSAADAQADVDAAQAALAEVNATLKTAETALATAKSDAESAQDAYDKAHKVVTPSKDTTITVDTPDSANSANRAAVKTSTQAKLGDTGVDVMETAVFTIMAAGTAGATLMLKRRGDGRYGLMARHAK
jgi:multidrug efflux pump subunit AcrA (membrane-fusion protein)